MGREHHRYHFHTIFRRAEYFEENDGPMYYTLMTLAQHPTVRYGVKNYPSLGLAFVGPNNFVLRFSESMQDKLLQLGANRPFFEHVEYALERAVYALANDGCMQEGKTNAQVLHEQLVQLTPSDIGRWQSRVNVWGTDHMRSALAVVNTLFDSQRDFSSWREQVASSWGVSEVQDILVLPTDVQAEQTIPTV